MMYNQLEIAYIYWLGYTSSSLFEHMMILVFFSLSDWIIFDNVEIQFETLKSCSVT